MTHKYDLYERLDDIESKLGFIKKMNKNQIIYEAVLVSGEFIKTLYDYGAGFLFVTVSWTIGEKEGMYVPFISITTIDDESWDAHGNVDMSLEHVKKEVDKIVKNWIWRIVLPTEDELNEYLKQYGLIGKYNG